MVTFLLKKSYQLSNLKEAPFKDLWGSKGVFTTMRMVGRPPKLILLKPHLENLIKSSKLSGSFPPKFLTTICAVFFKFLALE